MYCGQLILREKLKIVCYVLINITARSRVVMIMSVDALVYNIVHVKYESLLAFFRP